MTVAKSNGTTTMDATTTVFTENEKKLQSNALLPYKGGEDDDDDDEITLEDLAPDGGWGWMVAFAMIVVFITTFGPTTSFAIIFGDFLEATGQAGTAMTLFNFRFYDYIFNCRFNDQLANKEVFYEASGSIWCGALLVTKCLSGFRYKCLRNGLLKFSPRNGSWPYCYHLQHELQCLLRKEKGTSNERGPSYRRLRRNRLSYMY